MRFKRFIAIFLTVFTIVQPFQYSYAGISIPEKIRIGLFFGDTATSKFTISAEKGITVGYTKENVFNAVFEETTKEALSIRKDAYFMNNNGVLTEYLPASTPTTAGTKLGPYHIKIPGVYTDYLSAVQQVQIYQQNGIDAYVVYCDTIQIWTGFFVDENLATASLAEVQRMLGVEGSTVVLPSKDRLIVSNAHNEVYLVFDSLTSFLQIAPNALNSPSVLNINGKLYRGLIEVRRFSDSDLTVINVLPSEEYLYGVVPSEIESYSHIEAIKAQAVAARTYMANNINKYIKWSFNLCNSTKSQVYKGYSGEASTTNQAVDATKGKVVTYNGNVAQVFYFSSSGGWTEDAKNVWSADLPYLKSVEDKYESGKSWNYLWHKTVDAASIKSQLIKKGTDLGDITGIKITKKSDTGRAIELEVQGTKDKKIYTKESCRNVLGLESQWYNISSDADIQVVGNDGTKSSLQLAGKKVMTASGLTTISASNNNVTIVGNNSKRAIPATAQQYIFEGRGWGHAVGMSQEGAKGMANAGFTYDAILMHYFQGTKILP